MFINQTDDKRQKKCNERTDKKQTEIAVIKTVIFPISLIIRQFNYSAGFFKIHL